MPARRTKTPADTQYMTEKEVAALLRVVPSTVRAIRAQGGLTYVKLGAAGVKGVRVIYPRADVERFIAERTHPAGEKAA